MEFTNINQTRSAFLSSEENPEEKENEVASSELQDALRIRDEFLSLASHEIRTPLTRILLNLQLIRRRSSGMSESVLKSLEDCESSTKNLSELVDNLVDVSRLRLGKLEVRRTKTNIAQVMVGVLSKFEDSIRLSGNKVTLDHDSDVVGYWDQARLDQLFTNLLSNSLKHAPGKDIKMELRKKEEQVIFVIQDEGPGIPVRLQNKIFERFERGPETRNVSGLGLGLYVCRLIVEAHQGEICLESERGRGARFIVSLPLKLKKG